MYMIYKLLLLLVVLHHRVNMLVIIFCNFFPLYSTLLLIPIEHNVQLVSDLYITLDIILASYIFMINVSSNKLMF